ncbi:CHC2 zinc finger domain-containing protein [Nitrospirillum amazonense]|uniref:CHC2 zinc finger domain-containing protein n=1 Tax=Nitrospirillum amazonense TaxID=28077 RepID=UPI0011A847E7
MTLRRQGKDLAARCPFHEETTASLVVSPEKNLFHCFGCGAALKHGLGMMGRMPCKPPPPETGSPSSRGRRPKPTSSLPPDSLGIRGAVRDSHLCAII